MGTKERNSTTFWLKSPSGKRRSFAIAYRERDQNGTVVKHGTFTDERTTLLNSALTSEVKQLGSVEKEFRRIIEELQKRENQLRGNLPIFGENEIVFEEFWKKKYATKMSIDSSAAKNETIRAIQSVGEIPLMSADLHEIQNAVNIHCGLNSDKQRRIISRLKSVLRVIGRSDIALGLSRMKEERKLVKHITYRDLPALLGLIRSKGLDKIAGVCTETYLAAVQLAFWSGLRIGELEAIDKQVYSKKHRVLSVDWQISDKGRLKETKNKKSRKTHIPLQGEKFYSAWLNAPDRKQFKRKEATKFLKSITMEFSDDETKHISFHGLRRSYACLMLRHFGFDINDVADFLGDSVVVAKKFYAGFVADDVALERAAKVTAKILR